MRRLTTLALLAVGVSACGGGASPSEVGQVKAVVLRYFAAYAGGRGSELCPLLAPGAQARLVEVVGADEQERRLPITVHTCLQAIRYFGPVPQVEKTQVLSVSITGADATVMLKAGSLHAGSVSLSRGASGWIISSLPGEA